MTVAALGPPAWAQLAPTTQPRPGDLPTQTAQPVKVERAWIRARLEGQDVTAAYMTLTSRVDAKLVGVTTPAAGQTELHQMSMDGDVMRMRAVDAVALPAGRSVELKPGGLHLMLMNLKAPLAQHTSVPLTLIYRTADGNEIRDQMQVPVLLSEPPAGLTGPAQPPKN